MWNYFPQQLFQKLFLRKIRHHDKSLFEVGIQCIKIILIHQLGFSIVGIVRALFWLESGCGRNRKTTETITRQPPQLLRKSRALDEMGLALAIQGTQDLDDLRAFSLVLLQAFWFQIKSFRDLFPSDLHRSSTRGQGPQYIF